MSAILAMQEHMKQEIEQLREAKAKQRLGVSLRSFIDNIANRK